MRQASDRLISAWIVTALMIGCKPSDSQANLNVTNGAEISESEFPAVVMLKMGASGLCTGTFVSSSTLLTAAHCVETGSVRTAAGVPASRIWSGDLKTDPNDPQYWSTDLAVVLFPVGTAPATAALINRAPRVNDSLTIVGFGKNDLVSDSGVGVKRKGTNKIQSVDSGEITFVGTSLGSDQGPLGTNSASGSGDSGGPLFIDGMLAGVTAGGTIDDANATKTSKYVDLTSTMSRELLSRAVSEGADIPGVTAAASQVTPSAPPQAAASPTQSPASGSAQPEQWVDPYSGTAFPYCASSSSDPDGDGWGWENAATCKVRDGVVSTPAPAPEPVSPSPAPSPAPAPSAAPAPSSGSNCSTADYSAGPISSNADAQSKCPTVCRNAGGSWNQNWTTTVSGVESVCGCKVCK